MAAASSSPRHYDKFTYAVKRRNEKDTPSPTHPRSGCREKSPGHLAPLAINRDGFAVAEDGSLQSRVVSPPRWLHIETAVPQQHPVIGAARALAASHTASPARFVGTVTSPTGKTSRSAPVAEGPIVDPWATLVARAAGDLTEEELTVLHWDTVVGLLSHYKISHPIDVAKAQLQWKQRQMQLIGEVRMGSAESVGNTEDPSAQKDVVLMHTAPLTTSPIQVIAYGRPSSPRPPGRFVPAHKKPLHWNAEAKVDTGRNSGKK